MTEANRKERRIAISALLLVWLAFDFPVLAGRVAFPVDIVEATPPLSLYGPAPKPANPLESDAAELYYPWRTYLGNRLGEAELPTWDPHRLAGTPFAANPQMGAFYPPNWLFAVVPFLLAYTIVAVGSRVAALLLAYWFFRILRLHPYASAVGALAFTFSGFMVGWWSHTTFISTAMWLPLALGGLTVAIEGSSIRRGVLLGGLGLALSVLGGQSQVTLYAWLAAGVWGAVLVGARGLRERSRTWLRVVARKTLVLVATFVLGASLAALQILSTAELSRHIIRGAESYEYVTATSLETRHAALLFIPDRYRNPVDGNFVGTINYTETAGYVGIVSLVLAVVALWRRRDRMTLGLGLIGSIGFLAAFGTPVYRLLYEVVPGLSQTRAIGRTLVLAEFAFAGLAAVGMDALLRAKDPRGTTVLVGAGLVVGGLALALTLPKIDPPASYLFARVVLAAGVLVLGTALAILMARAPAIRGTLALAIVAVVGIDLWLFGFRYHPFQEPANLDPAIPEIQALQSTPGPRPRVAREAPAVLPLNGALLHDLYDVHGSDTFILSRMVELLSVSEDQIEAARTYNVVRPFNVMSLDSPVIDLLGVQRIVAPQEVAGLGPPVFAREFGVFNQPGALPATFVVSCWKFAPPGEAVSHIATMSTEELRSTAIVDGRPEARAALGSPADQCQPGVPSKIEHYEAERIVVSAEASQPSLLVVTDAWYPGWEATVDGQPVPVLVADHALRGIPIGPGQHRVELSYRPRWLLPGILLTLVGSLGVAGTLLLTSRKLRKS